MAEEARWSYQAVTVDCAWEPVLTATQIEYGQLQYSIFGVEAKLSFSIDSATQTFKSLRLSHPDSHLSGWGSPFLHLNVFIGKSLNSTIWLLSKLDISTSQLVRSGRTSNIP